MALSAVNPRDIPAAGGFGYERTKFRSSIGRAAKNLNLPVISQVSGSTIEQLYSEGKNSPRAA